MINRFEDIIAWQKARELTVLIYVNFKNCRDYSFKDQIQKASVSIMNNISEGFERKGNKEFERFLFIAKASSAEVRSMLMLALDIKYIENDDYMNMHQLSDDIARLLSALIKSIK
jgi:four helix bundle protein